MGENVAAAQAANVGSNNGDTNSTSPNNTSANNTSANNTTPNNTTACLLNNRFKVTIAYDDPYIKLSGDGKPIRYTENVAQTHPEYGPLIEYAFFSFFDFFPGSVETMITGVPLSRSVTMPTSLSPSPSPQMPSSS